MAENLFLEIAKLFFSGISATAAAIGVWQKTRDSKKSAAVFDDVFDEVKESDVAEEAAVQLVKKIPGEVIKDLEARADLCWTNYRNVLGGEYLPAEIDQATAAVQACVCRELTRIKVLNGDIPERWMAQWEIYSCAGRMLNLKMGQK